jgi:hypothetical protein
MSDLAAVHELVQAVVDVEAHASERGHQGLDIEGFLRPGVEESEQTRTERRLHEQPEA